MYDATIGCKFRLYGTVIRRLAWLLYTAWC